MIRQASDATLGPPRAPLQVSSRDSDPSGNPKPSYQLLGTSLISYLVGWLLEEVVGRSFSQRVPTSGPVDTDSNFGDIAPSLGLLLKAVDYF